MLDRPNRCISSLTGKDWALAVRNLIFVIAFTTTFEGAICASAGERIGKSESQTESSWPYSQPPWQWRTDFFWGFFGTHTINGSHPPDNVPDPNVIYGPQPIPSSFVISRYLQSPWGDWDQLVVVGASGRVGKGPNALRATQAFSSAVPPTLPEFPLHVPHRLARFEWAHRSDGGTDLKLYSPPNSSSPIFSVWGLGTVPFIKFPIGYELLPATGIGKVFQSVVDSYDPLGPIRGYVAGEAGYEGTGGISLYSRFETSDALDLDGGFYNVGFYIEKAITKFTVQPYPPAPSG